MTGITRVAPASTDKAAAAEREQIAVAAAEFEAMFLLQMLKEMRRTMLDDEDGEPGLGAGTLLDTVDSELARQLASRSGTLAPELLAAMDGRLPSAGAAPPMVQPSPVQLTPARGVTPTAPTGTPPASGGAREVNGVALDAAPPIAGRVSSPFGWREDPFTGARRFHAGVDIAAAYGRPVPVAADGVVVSAGPAGGYGQTVVVEHAGGVRTRYAHLASIEVREGERIRTGVRVGTVGHSGRATGPHLHFEVLENGRPVDPGPGRARLAAALKDSGVVADYPSGPVHITGAAPRRITGADDED